MRLILSDPRDGRIAELQAQVVAQARRIEALESKLHQLDQATARHQEREAQLEAVIAGLRARLGENSRNSSKPPSSDRGKARRQRPRKKPSGHRRGGQLGHAKATRPLLPPEQVDRITDVLPPRCRHCDAALHGRDDHPHRHQVVELPPVKPIVYEWRLHQLACAQCGQQTRALAPAELAHGHFGPRLAATVAVLTGMYRLSKRHALRLLEDVMGLELALGTISKLERRTSRALMEPVAEVAAAIHASPVVHIDETSWTEEKRTAWLWSASTPTLAYFHIAGRTRSVSHQILGTGFEGILVSDRMASYADRKPDKRQVCWAHLDRTFEGIIEHGGPGARFGQAMKNLTILMWRAWGKLRDGKRTRVSFERFASKLAKKVRAVLYEFSKQHIPHVSPLAENLLAIEPALWTFVHHPEVEPTNNDAERALRQGVIHRKTSFGTDSPRGSCFIARMLSTVETLRRQGRRVFTFLVELLASDRSKHPRPSLLCSHHQAALA